MGEAPAPDRRKRAYMEKRKRKRILSAAAVLLGIAFMAFVCLFDWDSINSYTAYNTSSTDYARGVVESVDSETIEKDDTDPDLYLGEQELSVTLLQGDRKGETISVTNYLTKIHSIMVSEGQRVIVLVDDPDIAEPYYMIYGYDRTIPLIFLIVMFAAAVILVGKLKGLRALLGVAYSMMLIIMFLLQALYHGFRPVTVTFITVVLATGASLLLLNGFSRRTAVGVLSTLSGVGVTAIIFGIFSKVLHLSGYNLDSAETLIMVGETTGMSIRHLLLVAVLISSLGAVMDISVSLAASMEELVLVNPGLDRKKLFRSGMNIGKDMIGTMSNTLIMAFVGSQLDSLLCLLAYGYHGNQLFSSDYLAIEISQGLCATMGVVLSVPVSAIIASLLYVRKNRAAACAETEGSQDQIAE